MLDDPRAIVGGQALRASTQRLDGIDRILVDDPRHLAPARLQGWEDDRRRHGEQDVICMAMTGADDELDTGIRGPYQRPHRRDIAR